MRLSFGEVLLNGVRSDSYCSKIGDLKLMHYCSKKVSSSVKRRLFFIQKS